MQTVMMTKNNLMKDGKEWIERQERNQSEIMYNIRRLTLAVMISGNIVTFTITVIAVVGIWQMNATSGIEKHRSVGREIIVASY